MKKKHLILPVCAWFCWHLPLLDHQVAADEVQPAAAVIK